MFTQHAPDGHPTPTPTTILGGGLAGLAFAYFANLAGERVKLFEAAPFPAATAGRLDLERH